MSIVLLKNTKLMSKIKYFHKENKRDILDIILFGSSVRGKEKPEDIDLLLIYKDKIILDLSYKLRKMIEEHNLKVEIISKTYNESFSSTFLARTSILSEGFSITRNNGIAEGFGYSNFMLYKYSLKGFSKSDRMRFYYSLYGRNGNNGIIKNLNLSKFSGTILLSSIDKSEQVKEFFENWKINYIEIPILIPTQIIKSSIIKR